MRCGFLFSKSGMLFVIIGLWFFCGLFFWFFNFELEKFKCQTYRSHVRPCGLRGLCGLRGMLLSHTQLGNLKIVKYLCCTICFQIDSQCIRYCLLHTMLQSTSTWQTSIDDSSFGGGVAYSVGWILLEFTRWVTYMSSICGEYH